jgi:hypothetical protein
VEKTNGAMATHDGYGDRQKMKFGKPTTASDRAQKTRVGNRELAPEDSFKGVNKRRL